MSSRETPQSPALEVGLHDPRRYLPELEALRGVAILLVVVFHGASLQLYAGKPLVGTTVSPAVAFLAAGHTGVGLFFVLSAFLLSQPFLAESDPAVRVSRLRFYQRRALRILPLYYAWVGLAVLMTSAGPADWGRAIPYLFFLESFPGMTVDMWPYSAVWWSLATEFQFYLLLPLLGLAQRSPLGRQVGAAGLLLYAASYAAFAAGRVSFSSNAAHLHVAFSLFGQGPIFLAGIAAAWLYSRHGSAIRAACARRAWLRNGGSDVLLLLALWPLGRTLQRVVFVGYEQAELDFPGWHLVEGLVWALVVLIVLLLPLRTSRLITSRPLQIVGVLSYSLYLCHLPLIGWLTPLWGAWKADHPGHLLANQLVATAAMVLVAIAVSAVTYALIERPFLRRKARVAD